MAEMYARLTKAALIDELSERDALLAQREEEHRQAAMKAADKHAVELAAVEAQRDKAVAHNELCQNGDGIDGEVVEITPPIYKGSHRRYARRDFTLAEIEEACMRFRLAGANDYTAVRTSRRELSANVADELPPAKVEADAARAALRAERAKFLRRRRNRILGFGIPAVVFGPLLAAVAWWSLTHLYGLAIGLVA